MPSFLDKLKGIKNIGDVKGLFEKKEEERGEDILKSMEEAEKEPFVVSSSPVELKAPSAKEEMKLLKRTGEAEETAKTLEGPAAGEVKESVKGISFTIDLRPKAVELPPFKDIAGINIKYPVMPPYAYAHIYWDKKNSELLYEVEEPELTKVEKNLLRLIQLGLEEMINVSFVRATKSNLIMQYLEKNVQSILVELGTKVTKETYFKVMYYVYRDSIGLNEIEPLLNDYFIEDIECNGQGFPIYIVHRKYQNLRTNITFMDGQRLTDFVEKLAQKAGRYVSYARPILDGTLPDGSRINATYTSDVTTRGPTFTIRKFTKEPWTPIHLISTMTASADVFAFLWLAIEHKFNIMVIGETASGKTTFMNSILHFVPPEARVCSIEDTRELNIAHDNWLPAVVRTGFGIPNVSGVQYGEITLFDLLRETFRQNPDYVVVGEVRGKETYVLFQGMASGHPSFSTFHANSVETLVRRLETPPINLSPSLVESLDIVCVTSHIKARETNIRKLMEMDEIIEVKPVVGGVSMNKLFVWDPVKDVFKFNGNSNVFKKIFERTGISQESLMDEMKIRTRLLEKLAEMKITDFREVNEIVNSYIKNRDGILKKFNISGAAASAHSGAGRAEAKAKAAETKKSSPSEQKKAEPKKAGKKTIQKKEKPAQGSADKPAPGPAPGQAPRAPRSVRPK